MSHLQLTLAIATPALAVLVATLISMFQDPDHDPATPPPKWVQVLIVLQKILTAYAPAGTHGIAGTRLSVPLLHYPSPFPSAPPAAAPRTLLTLGLLFMLPNFTGCGYCLDVAHKSEPRCQAQDVASKCGLPAVQKIVEQILPQVVLALANDSWSTLLDNIVNTLEQQGVQDALAAVTCAVSNTNVNISSVLGGGRAESLNPAVIQSVHEHAVAWLGLHSVGARASR